MSIRLAQKSDLVDIQRLNQQLFKYEDTCNPNYKLNIEYSYSEVGEAYFKKCIKQEYGNICFMYETEGKSIGYITLLIKCANKNVHRHDVTSVLINTFCVDKNYRNKGIGTAMVAYVKKWAQEQGATHLQVTAMFDNIATRKMYEKCDFKESEITYEMPL